MVTEYAKLAMAPLWTEIMGNINPIIQERNRIPPGKMAIISGHDDTISPLMASLGIWNDTQWPAYASMFLIEVRGVQCATVLISSRTEFSGD